MPLNWIHPEDFSFNCFLLMDRFQIQLMMEARGFGNDKAEWKRSMGIALKANPCIQWFFEHKNPACAPFVREILEGALPLSTADEIRAAEVYALASVEDFVAYTRPERMSACCDFIYGWDKERLFEMACFSGKVVLDVGSGSGRLAFAAAEKATWGYASEPMDMLREYMRERIHSEGIKNMRVVDGVATALPYPDATFDIVMSGHVMGDDYDAEIAEFTRVCKPGGWLLDCPGDQHWKLTLSDALVSRGWEPMHYIGSFGADVYRYRKQVSRSHR